MEGRESVGVIAAMKRNNYNNPVQPLGSLNLSIDSMNTGQGAL